MGGKREAELGISFHFSTAPTKWASVRCLSLLLEVLEGP